MPERLQEEPDLRSRAILFGFPAQISAIKKPIADFLNRIFEPTRYQTSATLRGFYFTSGTQEGTPFDQVIGALQKSYGVESFGAAAFSGVGQELLPARPAGQGGVRRSRLGVDQYGGGAPLVASLRAPPFALIGAGDAGDARRYGG